MQNCDQTLYMLKTKQSIGYAELNEENNSPTQATKLALKD